MTVEQNNASLGTLILVCAILLVFLVGWCVLSTCLGGPILRGARNAFQDVLEQAEQRVEARDRRRRAGMGEPAEEWEMGRTRRGPMLT
ncbi:hypothetical protein FS749_016568 [Ceratobasidium sp. UAMH 11750]|nr:hypothetical protein FS749_016568 [Ceratobasidium sp. UAMH 11750]